MNAETASIEIAVLDDDYDFRHYIEDIYEHRHQREFGQILGLAWTLLRSEQGGLPVLFCRTSITGLVSHTTSAPSADSMSTAPSISSRR